MSDTSCVVLVRDFDGGMTQEILQDALGALPGVTVAIDTLEGDITPDLIIEPTSDPGANRTATIRVSDTGESVAIIPIDQLTEATIAMAINAVRADHRPWLETVVEACNRIDQLLEAATELAAKVYRENGDYADWRAAFTNNQTLGPNPPVGDPLESPLATTSTSAESFLARLGDSRFIGRRSFSSSDHPFAELARHYGLTGRHIDTVLLCFVNDLDPRYGRRFAYLQQDPFKTAPTIELVAALLGTSPADRLQIQRDFLDGRLVRSGVVVVAQPSLTTPLREATIGLDPITTKILLGDLAPSANQEVLNSQNTARALPEYEMSSAARAAVDLLDEAELVHLHCGDQDLRRSAALDVAYAETRDLLVVDPAQLSPDQRSDAEGSLRIDPGAVEPLRRELIRLDVVAFVDGLPAQSSQFETALRSLGSAVITGGQAPLGFLGRSDIEVAGQRGAARTAIWQCAEDWTGISVAGGTESLRARFSVSVDKATQALQASQRRSIGEADPTRIAELLTASVNDDAGGLLTTAQPLVTLADLIVDDATMRDLRYACARIRNRDAVILDQGWDRRSGRLTGTYLLLAGPSGTGKTMAAEAIAGELALPVQRLELSSLLSRWVGEFERAVDTVFAAAEATGGIVVVNEADSILAPRTEVDSAQARYSNAGTSHLLSRLEQFRGHVIFTTNLVGADSIDSAFHRRLTATIRFRLPERHHRLSIWSSVWPDETTTGEPVHYTIAGQPPTTSDLLARFAEDHPLSGGSIANVARTAAFLAADRRAATDDGVVDIVDIDAVSLEEALRLELDKIGDFRLLMHAAGAQS